MRTRLAPVLLVCLLIAALTPACSSFLPTAQPADEARRRYDRSLPGAVAVVITAGKAPTATEVYASRAFSLLGLAVTRVEARAFDPAAVQPAGDQPRVLWFTTQQAANRLDDRALKALGGALESGASGFLAEISGPLGRLGSLTGDRVAGAKPLPPGSPHLSRFTTTLPGYSQELSGVEFTHAATWAGSYLELTDPAAAKSIIETAGSAAGLPRLVAVQRERGTLLLQAGQPGNAAIARPIQTALRGDFKHERLHVEAMLEAVPVLLFAKFAAGDAAWHNPQRLANLTIDDPPLAQPFWDQPWTARFHSELLAHAEQQNFHITMATVPAHYPLAKPDVIALYRDHPDRLSLSVHGRDHACPDYGPQLSEAERLGAIRESKLWLDQLTKPNGLKYGLVMTFPCDGYTVRDLQAIQRWNFIAGSNTPGPSDLPAPVAWDHHAAYVSAIDGAPHATRQVVADTVFPLDFALDRPVVLFEHPQYFESNYGRFDVWAQRINAVGNVRWVSLDEAIRRHVWQKRNLDGTYSAQLFTADAILANPGDAERSYHAWLPFDGGPAIDRVLVDGQPAAYELADGAIRLDVTVPAKAERHLRILYREPQPGEYATAETLAASVSGPNLVSNPGFDEGQTGWGAWHAAVEVVDGGHRGNAARVTWQDAGPSEAARDKFTLSNWPGAVPAPKPGETYAATAWIRGLGPAVGKPAWLVLREYTEGSQQSDTTYGPAVMLSDEWQQVTVRRTVRLENAVNLTVHVELAGAVAGSAFEADDFVMWRVE